MPNPAPDLFASPNGDIAPEAANGNPGWRIARMEMLNWGTFHRQVHIITPAGGWSLLVGENGSGKSTAVGRAPHAARSPAAREGLIQ